MLLDPEIALPHVLDAARAARAAPGCWSRWSEAARRRTPDGLRSAELLPGVGRRPACGGWAGRREAALRLRADREDADGANAAVLRAAVADCAAHHLLLVVEVLVYRLDDEDEAAFAARGAA